MEHFLYEQSEIYPHSLPDVETRRLENGGQPYEDHALRINTV